MEKARLSKNLTILLRVTNPSRIRWSPQMWPERWQPVVGSTYSRCPWWLNRWFDHWHTSSAHMDEVKGISRSKADNVSETSDAQLTPVNRFRSVFRKHWVGCRFEWFKRWPSTVDNFFESLLLSRLCATLQLNRPEVYLGSLFYFIRGLRSCACLVVWFYKIRIW